MRTLMPGAGLLNLGSLLLGLLAWGFPIVNLIWRDKVNNRHRAVFSVASVSVSACAISLCLQIFYSDYLVKIEDWSALLDTSGAVAFISAVLLAVTLALNIIVMIMYSKKSGK